MLNYDKLKEWLNEPENKNKVVIAASFVAIFFVGFGTGNFEKAMRRDNNKLQNNYTTSQTKKPAAEKPQEEGIVAGDATTTPSSDCPIKGNISASGKKIYHVKGGVFYERTKAEQCFNTEKEAVAAGFVKSSR